MTHSFNVEIAAKYGILEAILFQNIYYWITKNEANNTNYHDGRYWTYNSINAYRQMFPYATDHKLRTALKRLEEDGLIVTGNYNTDQMNRTQWYALSDYGLRFAKNDKCILQNCQMDLPKMTNASAENGKCLNTNNKQTNINTNNKTIEDTELLQSAFNDWLAYKTERREGYKPTGLQALITRLQNDVGQYGEQRVIEAIRYSMAQGWKGIYYPHNDAKTEQTNPASYDINRAEQRAKTTVPKLVKRGQ